jgi:non-heme chloroperoxidase
MDHYADDLAALTAHLDLKDAIHVGHSTGGGEVVHYLARRGQQDVYKAAIISAVRPLMLKTDANPEGMSGGITCKEYQQLKSQYESARRRWAQYTNRPLKGTSERQSNRFAKNWPA